MTSHEPVAIIGMGCRYPGAPDLAAFRRLLFEGIDAITDVPPDRWDADALKMTSRRGGFIEGLDTFDAAFFGISPREAPHVDPRQRLVLESAWEALEAAGIAPSSLAGSHAGVFVATLTNDYDAMLFADLRRAEAYSGAGTANSIVANRISYLLDLHGPSLAIDTACSGSLVAIHLACESIRRGESTLAIAGGVNVNLLPRSNVFFSRAGALSPDGTCRTFDARADGMVRSDGCGILILEPLARAIENGRQLIAVIAGSAVNHDGRSNGIMAPNGEAQRAVLREAYRNARIAPERVQFVEAHGTGTKLGDPIEVDALGDVLGARCVLGSVKTNIGHTEAAAGVAGTIKTALALQERRLPPTLHFRDPNPFIPFDRLPFEVRGECGPWPRPDATLAAGVSGFGFGGTNAHLVLIEAPPPRERARIEPPYLLPVSARSPEALEALVKAYADVREEPGDVCFTAATGRTHYEFRKAMFLGDDEPTLPVLRAPLALVMSSEWWGGMGDALARRETVFREARERAGGEPRSAVHVALAALWRSWEIVPEYVVRDAAELPAGVSILPPLRRDEDELRTIFRTLGALYEAGHDITWRNVYRDGHVVALPHYPWQRQRYWLDQLGGGEPAEEASRAHPLLGTRIDAADSAASYWECELDAQHPRWMAEHRVFGDPVLPGAAWLEMALAAARERDPHAALAGVAFESPLRFDRARRVQVVASNGTLTLYARDGETWVRHAVARSVASSALPDRVQLDALRARCGTPVHAEQHYASMEQNGVVYGPAFRCIVEAATTRGETVAVLDIGPELADARYGIHPALLDAAVQMVAPAADGGSGFLPVAVGEWQLIRRVPQRVVVHAAVTDETEDIRADVTLCDEEGVVVARISGLVLRRTTRNALEDAVFALTWNPAVPAGRAAPSGRRVVDDVAAPLDALRQAQHAVATRTPLTIVVDDDLAGAGVWGLAASVALEAPGLRVRCVDATGDDLRRELQIDDRESRVVWRDGIRHVARLERVDVPKHEIRIRGDATYLITGAFGALGLATVESLLARGARHLALVSRGGGRRTIIEGLARGGAEIVPIAADVSKHEDVTRIFASLAAMPPLRGVVHAAGVLHDALLADQTPEIFETVFAPKVRGAQHLHAATLDTPLDFFILYSSAASILGSAGQSNYAAANAALDHLAQHRRAVGLPALSVNWGAFAGGMAADESLLRRFTARGVLPIDTRDAMPLLWRLAASDHAQAGVLPIDWPKFLQQFPGGVPPLFEHVAPRQETAGPTHDIRDAIAAARPAERLHLVRAHVRATLLSVLGFEPSTHIAPRQRLFEIGIDSLTALELHGRLETTLGLSLPSVLVFDHPTLEALSAYVASRLGVESAAAQPEGVAPMLAEFDGLTDAELARLVEQELGDGR